MLSPDLDEINSETAIETYFEFESDIHRIARFKFVKRLGGEPSILLTVSDIEFAGPLTLKAAGRGGLGVIIHNVCVLHRGNALILTKRNNLV
jgi:hypothetical protein